MWQLAYADLHLDENENHLIGMTAGAGKRFSLGPSGSTLTFKLICTESWCPVSKNYAPF